MRLTNRFTRVMSEGRRFIPEVDGLRFVAIAAVVLFHLGGYTALTNMAGARVQPGEAWLPRLLSIGHWGVQLFFVLSGFLLALPFAKWRLGVGSKPSLKTYYLRRLSRLEPPYIAAMLLLFIGGIRLLGTAGFSRWPNLLASLVYQHNLIYGMASVVNDVAWTLEVEVQFYVLAPFLAVVFSVKDAWVRRAAVLALILAAPAMRGVVPTQTQALLTLTVLGQIEFFAAGFLLADLFLVDWEQRPSVSLRWDLASLVGWSAVATLMLLGRFEALLPPCVLMAYVGAFRGAVSNRVVRLRWLTTIGGMCYSMYLLHVAVIAHVGPRAAHRIPLGSTFMARFAVEAAFALPAVLATTFLFFIFVERPCMDPKWPAQLAGWLRKKVRGDGGSHLGPEGDLLSREEQSG